MVVEGSQAAVSIGSKWSRKWTQEASGWCKRRVFVHWRAVTVTPTHTNTDFSMSVYLNPVVTWWQSVCSPSPPLLLLLLILLLLLLLSSCCDGHVSLCHESTHHWRRVNHGRRHQQCGTSSGWNRVIGARWQTWRLLHVTWRDTVKIKHVRSLENGHQEYRVNFCLSWGHMSRPSCLVTGPKACLICLDCPHFVSLKLSGFFNPETANKFPFIPTPIH